MKKITRRFLILILICMISVVPSDVYAKDSSTISQKVENFQTVLEFILENYVGEEVSEEDLFEAAIDGMFDILDPYSEFYTKEEMDAFNEQVSGEFVGVGIVIISEDNWVKVVRPILGSPAEAAGVRSGDIITYINGETAKGLTPTGAASLIKGEEGTTVTITFKRGTVEYTVDIVRATIKLTAITSKSIAELFPKLEEAYANKIKYISISSFNANVAIDMAPFLDEAKKNGVEYLILDLRNNSGGYVESTVDLSGMLIPKGDILHFVNKKGEKTTFTSDLEHADFKIAILTNKRTASASEFFAAAVKESGVGFIVGENTFGKGVAQYIYSLPGGYSFKITMEEFYSRDKNKINGVGVAPDYELIIPSPLVSETRLHPNEDSELVYRLELILEFLGYDIDEPNSFYDQKTEKAVYDFQLAVGLYPYGVCDFSTQVALNNSLFELINERDLQLEKALEVILEKMNEN